MPARPRRKQPTRGCWPRSRRRSTRSTNPDPARDFAREATMIPEALVAEAVKAAVGALTKEAVGPALAAGGRVWTWLKGKLTGAEAQAAVAAVEAEPAKGSARLRLSAALTELLETKPELAAELDR